MKNDTLTTPKSTISQDDFLTFFNIDSCNVEEFSISHSKDGVSIDVTLKRNLHQCPVCLNMTDKVKDYSIKKINHSILASRQCTITYRARRYRCPKCHKTFMEHNPFTVAGSRISLATVYNILEDLRKPNVTFKDVADRYHVSQTTAAHIFDSFVSVSRRPLPEYLLLDEAYAFKSANSKYVCVLVDFETQNIVDVLPSRRKQTLMDYFFNIPLAERKKVKIVSFDMWETYRIVSKIMFPNAICAVDHFHVKQEFSRKLDRIRIDVMNQYHSRKKYLEKKEDKSEAERLELVEASKHYYALKKFNWMFFTNDNRIFDPNTEKKYNTVLEGYYNYYDIFDYMVRKDAVLDLAYDLKYELDEFYSKSTEKNALNRIEDLIISFKNSQIKEMIEFGNTLSKWKYEIVNSFVPANGRRISNGLIENKNKAIKLLKHSSNGYLNWNRFRTRIMFSLNNDTTYHMYPINNKRDYTK